MANCSELRNTVPAAVPLNEMTVAGCPSLPCECNADCSASSLPVTRAHGALTQCPPDVCNLAHEAQITLGEAGGWKDVTRPESHHQKNILPSELEDSFEYIDSDKDYPLETGPQIFYNQGLASTECKPASEADVMNPEDSQCKNSVSQTQGSNAGLEVTNSTSNALLEAVPCGMVGSGVYSQKDIKGFVCPEESSNIAACQESDNSNRSDISLSGEFTNQLITGLSVLLPSMRFEAFRSDHVPDKTASISSSDTSHSQHDIQVVNNSKYSQPEVHNTSASSSETMQTDSLSPDFVFHRTSGNVAQAELSSEDGSSRVKSTPEVVSGSEQTALPTRPVSDGAAANLAKNTKKTPNDFIFGKVIGEGSYSMVYLAKEVSSQKEFAIKVCDKKHLIRERKTHFVMREKEVLMKLDHPFFIKLAYTFQDPERLYYVLTYARNGELLGYLHKLSAFDVPCTRFYSAEIVLALEYLHGLGIIHRDLKPENILLSEDMHIKITDFGTSKILSVDSNGNAEKKDDQKRKNSFVGTAEYVSPEVLNNQPVNYGSDLWALGCIIYQCLSGSLPFRSGNEYKTFQKIIKVEYDFPEGFHPAAKDLVQLLLVLEPTERLGMAPPERMNALKKHPFYEEIDWKKLPESTPPILMPYLPATATSPEFWGQDTRVGFDDQRLAEIITGQSVDGTGSPELQEVPVRALTQAEDAERAEKLRKQKLENQFHNFVEGNLIIKQGFVDKRKGLFARKRMLLLTEGPHLYYVDAHNKVLKGEIPWSKYLRPEAKNFKIFFVHTPNRTYYLESRQPDAQDWIKQIKDVWMRYYCNDKEKITKGEVKK